MGSTTPANSHDSWKLSQGAWDTHVHVFDPINFPYSPSRVYTPSSASLDSLTNFNQSLAETQAPTNIVLVQPSPYNTDNSLILSVLRSCSSRNNNATTGYYSKFRGIVVIDVQSITDEELASMHAVGVRGVRINLQSSSSKHTTFCDIKTTIMRTAERISRFGWVIELYVAGHMWDGRAAPPPFSIQIQIKLRKKIFFFKRNIS